MSVDIESTVRVECHAEKAFAFIADFENNPNWQGGMVSARWTSDPPVGVGSTYDQEARFMGKTIITRFQVTAYEPGRSISIESVESTFPLQITRRVEPTDTGCVITAHVRGQPGGLFKLAAPLMRRMVKRSVDKDYARLKALLESGSSTSGWPRRRPEEAA